MGINFYTNLQERGLCCLVDAVNLNFIIFLRCNENIKYKCDKHLLEKYFY